MFTIKYNFSKIFSEELGEIDEMTLRYYKFQGSVSFVTSSDSIDMNWGWIPLLDFAICLRNVTKSLNADLSASELDFTESDEKLLFFRESEEITIETSFSKNRVTIDFGDYIIETKAFYNKIFNEIINNNKNAANNKMIQHYYKW